MSNNLVCVKDFEDAANHKVSKTVREYFNSGANYEQTYKDNCEAFKRYRTKPRYMRNVANLDYSTTILGHKVSSPIGVSSMAICRLAHPDGEEGIAKASLNMGNAMTLACMASSTVDQIKNAAPGGFHLLQIFILRDRNLLLRMIRRAEDCGFKGLVLTIDCVVLGRRHSELRNEHTMPPDVSMPNLMDDRNVTWEDFVNNLFQESPKTQTWEDVEWLKSVTKLPIIAKGVIGVDNAKEALHHGIDAIWVSNHGGRELDTVPATIDVLPEIVAAVNGRCEIYLDGGIRSGLDALKALALGATAVFVGRPVLWGLVCNGTNGAEEVLRILLDELRVGMSLSGCRTLEDLRSTKNLVVTHESYLPKL